MSDVKRVAPRFRAQLEVRYKTAGAFIQEYTENISMGGLFVRTEQPLNVGDLVKLTVFLPGADRQLIVEGSVAHREAPRFLADADGAVSGMGVEFIELSMEDRQALAAYVKSLQGNGASADQ